MHSGAADTVTLIVVAIVVLPLAALWAVALVDVFSRADWEFPSRVPGSNDRLFWTFAVVFLSSLGAFWYYLRVMRPYPRRRR